MVTRWKFRMVDTPFRKYSKYEKEIMAALQLTGNVLHKAEMEYHENFGHILGRIQHIALMSIIDIFYETWHIEIQTVAPTLTGFQVIKHYVQYLDIHPHKPIFYPYNSYDGSSAIRLTWSGNQVEYYKTQNCLEFHQDADHVRILNRIRSFSGILHTLIKVAI